MKEKVWALILAALIAVMGYIMVSAADKHMARDEAALYHWAMSWADRR